MDAGKADIGKEVVADGPLVEHFYYPGFRNSSRPVFRNIRDPRKTHPVRFGSGYAFVYERIAGTEYERLLKMLRTA